VAMEGHYVRKAVRGYGEDETGVYGSIMEKSQGLGGPFVGNAGWWVKE